MDARQTVFIVEDDFLIMEYLRELSEEIGLGVTGTCDVAEEAVEQIQALHPDYVFMDLRLRGEGEGVDVAMAIQARLPETKIVYITGSNEPASLSRISQDHPHRVLIKPVVEADLRRAVGMAPRGSVAAGPLS
ncbi:response regulator [Jiella sonneratiae]|uniref:Response regulator n=1 Tax=Jiella sonneratiae TaxID=2816856 RepID=A0ABS3IXG9_9HYPH|nr:response regulator [Jiella sonneratiae]MBO0902113.1 response regulator [Jiella sonneratiae]